MLGFSEEEKKLIVASQRHRGGGAGPSLASDVAGAAGANGKASLADQWVDFLVEQVHQGEEDGGGGGKGQVVSPLPAAAGLDHNNRLPPRPPACR
jgi:hypothetical protein